MMFSEYAAKSQPQSGFNPANQPAAGVPSYIDNEHNYPFARKDSDKYVAPSNRTPDAQTANARAGQLMFRSDLVRSALTNTPHPDYHPMADSSKSGHQSGQGRGMVKPAYENVTSAEEYDRLAQARNRKTYDAASFCVEGPRRRLKSGPGWEGPAAYRNGERPAANPALYSTHRFHLKGHHKPSVRAGTDGMLRSLGFHHAADTPMAGAPSKLRNRYVDDSAALSRGPAMTINSQMMNPSRNPVTGHNMGEGFRIHSGERKISQKRLGHQNDREFHARRGEDSGVTTHTRMFGQTYIEQALPTGLKTSFSNDGSGAGGTYDVVAQAREGGEDGVIDAHRHSQAKDTIFPESQTPIDYDRRVAAAQYQTKLWKMHEELPGYGEDKMIRAKYGY